MEVSKGFIGEGLKLAVEATSLKETVPVTVVDKEDHYSFDGKTTPKEILTALNEKAGNYKVGDNEMFNEHLNFLLNLLVMLEKEPKKATRFMFQLNTKLLYTTFMAGSSLSVVDLMAMPGIASVVKTWNPKQQGISCNITRWFNHVQHLDEWQEREVLELVQDKPPPEKKPKKNNNAEADNGKKGEKKKQKQKQPPKAKDADKPLDISRCEFVVGKIVDVEKHPNADSLYVEKIDCGEESGPRTVVSGLVKYVPIDQMKDRMVVVFFNLKPSNLKSIKSFGMVLCGSSDDHTQVELLTPPEGTKIGERLTCEGYAGEPDRVVDMKKKTCPWPHIQPDLRVNDKGEASYKGVPLKSSAGTITVKSLKDCIIS